MRLPLHVVTAAGVLASLSLVPKPPAAASAFACVVPPASRRADTAPRVPWRNGRPATALFSASAEGEGGGSADASSAAEVETQPKKKKPTSRLAMAAADWLEEEDELASYWNRFDDAKSSGTKSAVAPAPPPDEPSAGPSGDFTTEERLDQYHASRGIDRRAEEENRPDIEAALEAAREASSPTEAIRSMEKVRPSLQSNTRLGGTALLELATALAEEGGRDPDAEEICETLLQNPSRDVRRGAAELLRDGGMERARRRKRGGGGKDVWGGLLDPTSWWN